jgi:hypothetical protein
MLIAAAADAVLVETAAVTGIAATTSMRAAADVLKEVAPFQRQLNRSPAPTCCLCACLSTVHQGCKRPAVAHRPAQHHV